MEDEQATNAPDGQSQNGDYPESEQIEQSDGLLTQDKEEVSERVAHLEKRVREQQDEIVCLKGAMADVMRRLGQVETTKTAQNNVLPSKPYLSPRRAPAGKERPRSTTSESLSRPNAPTSARQPPRGASAGSVKRWGSMSNSIEESSGHKTPRSGSQLTHAKRSTSQGALHIKSTLTTKGAKGPSYNREDKCVRMYLKGRPVALYAPKHEDENEKDDYDVNDEQAPPSQKLQLEWAYGYRGRDARSNLYQLPTGEIIYFCAAVVVLHDVDSNAQRHYLEHTDDVKCLAIHPKKTIVVTGQVAGHEKKEGKAHFRIWDSVSLATIAVLGEGDYQRAYSCLSFSSGGNLLLAVDESNNHNLSVWNIDLVKGTGKRIVESKSSGDPVTACEFHPQKDDTIVCCGKSQISFWSFENNQLNKKTGIFDKNDKGKYIICFAFTEGGDVISGDSNGNLYVWGNGGNKITKAIEKAHHGPIFSICVLNDNKGILTGGGKDRKIYQWDSNLEEEKKINETEIEEVYGAVRMISEGQGGRLFVGTIRNCILQSTLDFKFDPVVQSHKEELWGLACKPNTHQFLTCGYDKHIYMWDAQAKSVLWMKEIAEEAHCASIYTYGNDSVAVIGNRSGKWSALDLDSHEVICVGIDGIEQHECVEFSPDGSMFALGSRDNSIYVYDVEENGRKFKKRGRCSGHSSFVTHIDWSEDGTTIRSNSGDYSVLYWNAAKCKQDTDNDVLRNLNFATTNCTLCYNAIGCWPDGADGTDVNNCSRSNNKELLVSADDFGHVNLYVYPSIQPRAKGNSYQGHSSHVTSAKFLFDDSRVISCGGRDTAVLQWQVV